MLKKTVLKPWGKYEILEMDNKHWIKKLFIKKGHRFSLQSHKERVEIWIVLSGSIDAVKGNKTHKLQEEDIIKIERGEKHRITGSEDSWILEIAFGKVREEDIVRYEDDYGRID